MSYQVKIQNQHEFLNDVASLYESTARVFMEYIDNSLDSAAELRKGQEETTREYKYPYPIKITITVDPKKKNVQFLDNCGGMNRTQLKGLVENVNKSEKKARPWTNGRFGYGAQAFRSCCEFMMAISKEKGNPSYKIVIPRNSPEVEEETQLPGKDFPYESGTLILLKGFDRESWVEISPESLKQEIEKHFEGVLREEDVIIKLIWGDEEEVCRPFDYEAILGEKIEDEVNKLESPSYSKKSGPIIDDLKPHPIKIYLRITRDIVPKKRSIFLNKGRRIADIQEVKSFMNKSSRRTSVWGHNNLTGYIELNDSLEPVLTRNEFKRSRVRTAFYEYLASLENLLWEELQKANQIIEEAGFSKLEEVLSSILEKLAREDRLRFRETYEAGGELNFQERENGEISIKEKVILDIEDTRDKGEQIPKGEGVEVEGEITDLESPQKIKQTRKSGFRVRFNSTNEPPTTTDGKHLRSQYLEKDAIVIYTKHQDFKEREGERRRGEIKLTPRLAAYIASELSIWYKKLYYEKYKLEPSIKEITNNVENTLVDQADFVYRLETLLQPYVYKDLSELEAAT